MALDLLKYHSNPSKLYGVTTTDGELFNVGAFNGKQIWITSSKYETELSWNDAIEYCKKLNIDGHVDFRLPTKDELLFIYKNKSQLKTIVDNNETPFRLPPINFWSSDETSGAHACRARHAFWGSGYIRQDDQI